MMLVDDTAVDVSRLTGIPWCWRQLHQRGPTHPTIDLLELDWWDRWRIVWAQLGGHFHLDSTCVKLDYPPAVRSPPPVHPGVPGGK